MYKKKQAGEIMKRKVVAGITSAIILAVGTAVIAWDKTINHKRSDSAERHPVISVKADKPYDAAVMISDKLFKNGVFDGISVIDYKKTDSKELEKYKNLTTQGTIYSYELVYHLKTDDERAFFDNKIIAEPAETNVWLDKITAHRYIAVFENNGTYHHLLSRDTIMIRDDNNENLFIWTDDSFMGGDGYSECHIIQSIFENKHTVTGLEFPAKAENEGILCKLISEIELHIKPAYNVDNVKSRVYDITYNAETKGIYFRADLYTTDGKVIATGKDFSLSMNGGFCIYELDIYADYLPKQL